MAKITVESPNGIKGEFVFAYGLTYSRKQLSIIPNQDLKSHVERIRDVKIRDDDVYLASYVKSGTHWVWEIMAMLGRKSAEYEPNPKEALFLDYKDPDLLNDVRSPRILNSHWPCKLTPKGIFEKNIKIVHVQRNPKDVLVSLYHFYKNLDRPFTGSFQEFFPLFIGTYGVYQLYPWYKYVLEWERFTKRHPGQVLNLYYEDIKEDPEREIKKINEFLGTGCEDDLIRQIAHACHFENLKKADLEVKIKEDEMVRNRKPSIAYRKGVVGDWKNYLTVEQNEEMDEWLRENLVDTELKFRYSLD